MQAKSWRVFAFDSLFSYFSRGGWLRSIRKHQMGTVDKQGMVTMQELLVSALAQTDALTKLLIEKGLITEAEFMQKLSAERASNQALSRDD